MGAGSLSEAEGRLLAQARARAATPAERVWLRWTVRRYWGQMYRLLARLLDEGADVDAVLDEAFARAWQLADAVGDVSRPEPVLLRLAIGGAESHSLTRRPETLGNVPSVARAQLARGVGSSGRAGTSPSESLERAIARLPWPERVAVVLRDVEGIASELAADVLGVEPAVFRATLHRGRMALVSDLEGQERHGVRNEDPSGQRAAELPSRGWRGSSAWRARRLRRAHS